ncbi:MAG: hypothetical protein CMJ32_11980 [Phycisphaerae bacterium]|nr:hypothetical protein [Phycisphaerae bacterium]
MNTTPADGPRPHRGTLILVFGILSLVCTCWPIGVVAWVMANTDLAAMNAGTMDSTGRGMTTVGKVLGIVSICLALLAVVFNIILWSSGAPTWFEASGMYGQPTN